jgi:hypothetical protein
MGAVPLDAGADEDVADKCFSELLDFSLTAVFPSELSGVELLDSTTYSKAPNAFSNSS